MVKTRALEVPAAIITELTGVLVVGLVAFFISVDILSALVIMLYATTPNCFRAAVALSNVAWAAALASVGAES